MYRNQKINTSFGQMRSISLSLKVDMRQDECKASSCICVAKAMTRDLVYSSYYALFPSMIAFRFDLSSSALSSLPFALKAYKLASLTFCFQAFFRYVSCIFSASIISPFHFSPLFQWQPIPCPRVNLPVIQPHPT